MVETSVIPGLVSHVKEAKSDGEPLKVLKKEDDVSNFRGLTLALVCKIGGHVIPIAGHSNYPIERGWRLQLRREIIR